MQNPTSVQLRAALQGTFDAEMKAGLSQVQSALQKAIFEYAQETQTKWRQDILASGLSNAQKLAKTVRVKRYPNEGMNPAAQVYSTFPLIQRAFEQGEIIRSRDGNWLTIPNPDVWPGGRVRRQGGRGVRERESSVGIAERRFGPLRFIYNPHGASMLVTDARRSKTKAGTFRYASATATRRGNVETIVVFFLVKQARLPRMLRGKVIRDRAARNADASIERLFARHFEQAAAGPALLGSSQSE